MNGTVEMIGVGEGLMSQEVTLQITPGSLNVIQFRGIFWQPLDGEPRPGSEGGLRSFAGMDGTVIENEGDGFIFTQRARPVDRVEAAQEADEVALRLVALVLTISLRAAKSKAPIIARLRACPGASIRRSLPRFAQARAR